jgi:hypothetical protein
MIYPTKQTAKKCRVRVKSLSGGVNLREQPAFVEENQCSQINNMWYKNGCLENRPAIRIDERNKLYDIDSSRAFFTEFHIFDSKIAPSEDFSRLAMSKEFLDSVVRLKFFLIDNKGNTQSVAGLDFTRTSFNLFTLPHVNCAFYNPGGSGSGIYIMVTMYNYESSENNAHVRFYELSSDHSVWNNVSDEKLYIPTVYINGRGNSYGAMEDGLKLPEPTFAEPRSMLTGAFKCCFTGDGLSSYFRLPFDKLDNKAIICRLKLGDKISTWRVAAGATTSNLQTVEGVDIEMLVNRAEGSVTFYCGSKLAAIPISNLNALEITAYKTELSFLEALKSSACYCEFSSRIFLAGLEGEINGVYFSAQSNPFYFPQQNKFYLGTAAQKVTALCVHSRLLIVFKDSKTYSIISKNTQEYNLENILAGSEKIPTLSKVSYDTLSEEIGCDCIKTVMNCGNHLVWLNSRGAVCTIVVSNQYSKGNIYELSLNIESFLKGMDEDNLKQAVACTKDGYYIVFIGNKAVAMDYTAKGFRFIATCSDQKKTTRGIYWYIWEFPEQIRFENAFSFDDTTVLICSRIDNDCYWFGTATLFGSEDCIPIGYFDLLRVTKAQIQCQIKTKNFDFDEMGINKFLKKAYLSIKNGGMVSVSLYDSNELKDKKELIFSGEQIVTKEIYFLNACCREIALSICTTGETKICSIQLEAIITEG